MPELQFKGKEFVYNHHLSVPFRPLIPDAAKSIVAKGQAAKLDGNLVIHGDNLHALKALLPMYAGKVDCIFIDPPYNTGNEGWCYSDAVNAPYIKEWLDSNPVNKDDMLRHDKWLTMMYPRLRLLHELLADTGIFWMTLDDNEVHHARAILNEVFGEQNFLANVIWEKGDSPRMDAEYFSVRHDSIICYAKNIDEVLFNRLHSEDGEPPEHYDKVDGDGRNYYLKPLRAMGGSGESRASRPNLYYALVAPDGSDVFPKMRDGQDGAWRWGKDKAVKEAARIEWKQSNNNWTPYYRIFADAGTGRPPETIFYNVDAGSSRSAKAEIKKIFFGEGAFDTPKPTELIKLILRISTNQHSLVLDSFAGSGTTAHAVMQLNADDSGERRFILVEGEKYADDVTAERVRRVIQGYKFTGKQKTELLREPVNFTAFKNSHKLMAQVEAIENLHGHEYDKITKTVKDDTLLVVGEKDVQDKVEGLGGTFTYCTLGDPIDLKGLLSGSKLPSFEQIGGWLYNTATNEAFNPANAKSGEFYLGESAGYNVWLYYKPELDFLKSRDAALTLQRAEEVAAKKPFEKTGKRNLVFAPAKFAPNKALHALGVEYAPLPFALFKIDR